VAEIALGDDTAAKTAVDRLLANFNDNPLIARAVWDTGQYYRDLKKYEMANKLYQHVVKTSPDADHACEPLQAHICSIPGLSFLPSVSIRCRNAFAISPLSSLHPTADVPGVYLLSHRQSHLKSVVDSLKAADSSLRDRSVLLVQIDSATYTPSFD